MRIVHSYSKQTNTTYVYEVLETYWDTEKKQSRSKRRLIGKLDPKSGKVIPTGSRGRPKKDALNSSSRPRASKEEEDLSNAGLKSRIDALIKEKEDVEEKYNSLLQACKSALMKVDEAEKTILSILEEAECSN